MDVVQLLLVQLLLKNSLGTLVVFSALLNVTADSLGEVFLGPVLLFDLLHVLLDDLLDALSSAHAKLGLIKLLAPIAFEPA